VAVTVIGALLLTVVVTVTPPPGFDAVVVTEVVLVVMLDVPCEFGVVPGSVVAARMSESNYGGDKKGGGCTSLTQCLQNAADRTPVTT